MIENEGDYVKDKIWNTKRFRFILLHIGFKSLVTKEQAFIFD